LLNYIETGHGIPVILIHGMAASLYDWQTLTPALAQAGYRALAVDLLGHGASPKPNKPHLYSIRSVYAVLEDWMRSLDLETPLHLVGPLGFSLDDKREEHPDKDDLPDMLARWKARDPKKDTDKTRKHFFVSAGDIRENKYDLSINRYKETVYEEEEYDPPKEILDRMLGLEKEIVADMEALRGMLG